MKNNLMRVVLVLSLCVVVFAVWNKDKPSSSTSLRSSNPEILANWDAIETALNQDHTFAAGSPDGKHTQITLTDPISTPGDVTDEGVLYIKDVSAVVELHFKDESGNEIQMTSAGKILSASLDMKDEDNMSSDSATHAATQQSIKAYGDSATQTMTNKTLTSPVINTAISGTAFLDEDNMSSDSATKVASQQSIKAYADTKEAILVTQSTAGIFGSRTTLDSIGGTLVKTEVYKVGSDGFLTVRDTTTGGTTDTMELFTDSSNPPTTLLAESYDTDGNTRQTYTILILKDDYWKVVWNYTVNISWVPIGTGTCVKQ